MGKLEKAALVVSIGVIGGWSVFWVVQLIEVLEILEMAYGG